MRLPRDWLGPRDELIPFGAAAGRSPGAVADGDGGSLDDGEPESPQAADDFWGENSHSLHHALQGPTPEPDWRHNEPTPPTATARLRRARGSFAPSRFAPPGRRPVAAAVAIAVLVLVGIAAGAFSSGTAPAPAASGSTGLLAGVSSDATVGVHVAQALHGAEAAVGARRAVGRQVTREARRRITASRRVAHHVRVHAPAGRSSAVQGGPSPSTPTYAATSAGSSSTSSSTAATTRNEPAPTAVNASASHSSPVSPTGASGALGPVQSPNG